MSIENLLKVVTPPAAPDEAFSGPWEPVEAEVGTALPQDYKDFARLFGSGSFMEFVGINVPRTRSPYVRFEAEALGIRDRFMFSEDEELPYALWPEPCGLLPFGRTDCGDYLFWLTRGEPEDWRVVVWADRCLGPCETFDCDLTDFLAGVVTGVVAPNAFPEDLLPCEHPFRPYSDWPAREDTSF